MTEIPSKKWALLIGVGVLVVGLIVGVVLVMQRQLFGKKAAVPTGSTTVSISPAQANIPVGQSQTVTVYINPSGIPISAVAVRLKYNFSGASPEATVADIQMDSFLIAEEDWNCPIKTSSITGNQVSIDIACINSDTSGFVSTYEFPMASFVLNAGSVPGINPVVVTFDEVQSAITRKSDGEDILLTPSATGQYTIMSDSVPTQTPTRTPTPSAVLSPTPTTVPDDDNDTVTPTPTPTPGSGATDSTTNTTTTTTSSTTSNGGGDQGQLLTTGFSLPTILITAAGILAFGWGGVLLLR
ncbi:MAG: FMN-binding domain protein [Candidatus Amesbacteria bacterium GW2011_GWC1_47_15]|uniref:FMN-binding domain protein n=1 Tax=Candidatus Amesbacteria bacterium GW2011_GWC1_47_15 TaxID=1618364 RepID=A0A0G1S3F6_9BACT|nr:MAG: FMN-binding domain protein [Candidatus Amesbacteria bacterium GW2011_GWC1_47_15]